MPGVIGLVTGSDIRFLPELGFRLTGTVGY